MATVEVLYFAFRMYSDLLDWCMMATVWSDVRGIYCGLLCVSTLDTVPWVYSDGSTVIA